MNESRDNAIVRFAHEQHGVISSKQLAGLGVDSAAASRRRRNGMFETFHRGVYVLPSLRTEETLLQAAAIAFPNGAIARSTAAARLGLPVAPNGLRFVIPRGRPPKVDGLIFHQTRSLPADHLIDRNGLPLTNGARTLCDISPFVFDRRLEHLTEVALTKRATSVEELAAVVAERRRRGVKGIARFQHLLATMLDDEPYPESMFEVELMKGFAEVGLEGMSRQWRPPWYDGIRGTVDFGCCLTGRVVVEGDGRGFREISQAHDNDRQRDRKAARHGVVVIRIGYREFQRGRMRVLQEVKDIVEAQRRQANPSAFVN